MLIEFGHSRVIAPLLLGLFASGGRAQWIDFNDPDSAAECGVVNAANAAFYVDDETFQLVKINGTDTLFEDFVMDEVNNIVVDGAIRGFLSFDTDDNGDRTVWWVTLVSNNAIELDEFDAEVSDSGRAPDELTALGCDPVALLDNPPANDNSNSNDNTSGGGLLQGLCGAGMVAWMAPLLCGMMLLGRRPE